MAKGVGFDVGEFEIKVVELDGSLRKPRLVRVGVHRTQASDGPGAAEGRASDLSDALHESGVGKDGARLSFPGWKAVLRGLRVPFTGEENIRKVIKFEVEGSIHSHNVDDMVVDFLTLGEEDGETRVLVVAVPKPVLRASLTALEAIGIEPEHVDLDAIALLRTATWLGVLTQPLTAEGEGEGDGDEAPPVALGAAAGTPIRLVIDVGARSTTVLATHAGKVVDIRTLRSGIDTIAQEVASDALPLEMVRDSVRSCLETGEDHRLALGGGDEADDADEPAADGGDGEGTAVVAAADSIVVAAARVHAAADSFLSRFQRELVRFVASLPTGSEIEAVWITGGGSALPGVAEVVGSAVEVAPRRLDVLGSLSHDLDDEVAAELNPRLAVAVGQALAGLGAAPRLNFRREDLAFARQFERLKFPLAVACMLGLFFLVILGLERSLRLDNLRLEYGTTRALSEDERRGGLPYEFVGFYVPMLMQPKGWIESRLDRREYRQLCEDLAACDPFEQLDVIRDALQHHKTNREQATGYYADLSLESGMAVLVRMAEVLDRVKPDLGRYLITDLQLEVQVAEQQRYLQITFAFRGDFRSRYEAVKRAFAEDAKDDKSPFSEVVNLPSVERLWVDSEPGEDGAYMQFKVNLKKRFDVFQPEAQR